MTCLLVLSATYLLLQFLYGFLVEGVHALDRRAIPPPQPLTRTPASPTPIGTAVLIHGFADTPTTWQREADWLANHGYRVIAPLLSHESTEAEWLPTAIRALQTARAQGGHLLLIGHSMGGALALAAAATCPPDSLLLWAPFFAPHLGQRLVPLLYALHRLLFLWPRTFTFFPALRTAHGTPTFTYRVQRTLPVHTFAAMLRIPRLARRACPPPCPTLLLLPHRDTVVQTAATRQALPTIPTRMAQNATSSHALPNAADWRENLIACLEQLQVPLARS